MLEPDVGGVLRRQGVEFAFAGRQGDVAVGDASVGVEYHGDFAGLYAEAVGVAVEAVVDVGGFLGVGFEEVGVDDLETVCFDLFPAEGGTVLSEVDELRFGVENGEEGDGEKCQSVFHVRCVVWWD